MIRSMLLPSSSSFLAEPNDVVRRFHCPRPSSNSAVAVGAAWRVGSSSTICCSSRSSNKYKIEPYSKSWFDRIVDDLPYIQKARNELAEYCTTLEGDPCYYCWQACFELDELQSLASKEDVERLINCAGGLKSLISSIHQNLEFYKHKQESNESSTKPLDEEKKAAALCEEERAGKSSHVPEWLPKTAEELEEEEKIRMEDSAWTRLFKIIARGKFPTRYNPST